MIFSDKQFAVLIPTGIISEIARLEDTNGIPTYDQKIEEFIFGLSKIVLSQTNDTWLLKLREGSKVTEVLIMESVGCDTKEITTIMSESIEALISESEIYQTGMITTRRWRFASLRSRCNVKHKTNHLPKE